MGKTRNRFSTEEQFFPTEKIKVFYDGIYAIVVTLLVLDLHVPEIRDAHSSGQLLQAIYQQLPRIFTFILSFFIICVYWFGHHNMFRMVVQSDMKLFWLNNLMVLFICFTPYPTALMGEYPQNTFAVIFFGLVGLLTCFSYLLTATYVFAHPELVDPRIDCDNLKALYKKVKFVPVFAYAIAILSAFYNSLLAIVLYTLIVLFYAIMNRNLIRIREEEELTKNSTLLQEGKSNNYQRQEI
jgi:uncharacterized membrane protein